MIPLSFTSALYIIIVIAKFVQGDLLFAANINDFKAIAKKFIPDELAEKISEIAANPIALRQQVGTDNDKDETDDYDDQVSEYEVDKGSNEDRIGKTPDSITKKNFNEAKFNIQKVNVDQIAKDIKEKVIKELLNNFLRMKLKGEFKKSTQRIIVDNASKWPEYIDIEEKKIENSKKKQPKKENVKAVTKYSTHNKQTTNPNQKRKVIKGHKKQEENFTPAQLNGESAFKYDDVPITEKTDLSAKNNDSYEYYLAPEKEDNVFSSLDNNEKAIREHVSRYKIKTNRHKLVTERHDTQNYKTTEYEYNPNDEYANIKAITEKLWFDDSEEVQDTIILSDGTENTVQSHHPPKHNTIKPTRQRFSMSSPNYYASLPTVAERYSFDEPLPEKDRQRENIKTKWIPASSINKKVKAR